MIFYSHHSPFLLAAIMLSLLLVFVWKKNNFRAGQVFLLMIALVLFWNLTFFLELILPDLEMKILMTQFQFIAIAFLPVVWFAFTCLYTGFPTTYYHWLFLSIIPVLTNILIWFVPRPNWFWGVPAITAGELFPVLDYNYQFWFYYVHAPVSYGIFLLSIALFLRAYLKKAAVYRFQVLTLLVALLLPLIGDLIYVLGVSPVPGVNYSSAMMSFSAAVIACALYRYKFLDLLPMAHEIIFAKMSEGILVIDLSQRIVDINPAALTVLGSDTTCIGQPLVQLGDHPAVHCIKLMISHGRKSGSFYLPSNLEEPGPRYFECSADYVDDASGEHLASVISMRENTAQMLMFRKIHEQSIQDDLTGIFNRRYFFHNGARILNRSLWSSAEHLAILAIDIDNLKPINDRFGHHTGDMIITHFVDTARKELRPFDQLCRLGGDEFAVILPDTRIAEASVVADRILNAVAQSRYLPDSGEPLQITISIGAASSENFSAKDSATIEALLHMADTRMYEAKKAGGNQAISE